MEWLRRERHLGHEPKPAGEGTVSRDCKQEQQSEAGPERSGRDFREDLLIPCAPDGGQQSQPRDERQAQNQHRVEVKGSQNPAMQQLMDRAQGTAPGTKQARPLVEQASRIKAMPAGIEPEEHRGGEHHGDN